jgi:hypothetical protein
VPAQLLQAQPPQSAADSKEPSAAACAGFCAVTLGCDGPEAAGGVTGAAPSAAGCTAGPPAAAVELGRMCMVWQASSILQGSAGA